MKPTPEQIRKYFEVRLQGQRFRGTNKVKAVCPFHQDRTPSLSINLEKGVWKCFAGCGEGGMIAFEMKFSKCDEPTAKCNIADLIGEKRLFAAGQKPEAIYQYFDANGRMLFEKLRLPGKRFVQRRPDGKGGFEYKLGDCRKPLYRLKELLTAENIVVCEGEKDADNVKAAFADNHRVAATTNFDGAGKWRDEYSVFCAGKKVAILPDNDEPGRNHAERVARSVYPYAAGVKIITLPDLPEKGDVSDFLKMHTAQELLAEISKTPAWHPAPSGNKLLVTAPAFVNASPLEVNWLVEQVIERGANGFFCAVPKGGKSWAAIDLCISLALGCDWLGFQIPRPVRCALISREDNPALTGWRLRNLFLGKDASNPNLLEQNLYVNSRAQSPEFLLDNPEHVSELVEAFKERQIEFAVFDVFNVMHGADENDNTQMRAVLRQLSAIQTRAGCGIGVVHHFNKAENGSMTQRLRGAFGNLVWPTLAV
jgi:putative DNA primase/helicase